MALSITKYFSVYLYQSIICNVFFIKRAFVIRNSSEITDGDVMDTAIYNVATALQLQHVDGIPFNRNTM